MILLCWMSKTSITCPANAQPSFDIADTLCWSGEVQGHSSLQLPAVLHNRYSWTPTHSHCSRVYCAGGWLWQCTGGSQQRSRQTVHLLADGDSGHLTQCWLKSRGNTHHCLWHWVHWCTCESVRQSVCSFYFGFPTVALCPIFLCVPVCLSTCVCQNVCLSVSLSLSSHAFSVCVGLFVSLSLSFPLSPLLLSLYLSVWLPVWLAVFSSLCAFLSTSPFFVSSLFGHQQTISFKIQMHKLLKRN